MNSVLHHSTGVEMLDTDDRNEDLSWTEKQLKLRAEQISALLIEEHAPADWVEKSGTGMRRAAPSLEWYCTAALCNGKATVH